MIQSKISKLGLCSLLAANVGLAFAGTMGGVQSDSGKRFMFYVAPVYGSLNDQGVGTAFYADTISATGGMNTNQINLDSRWGYSLGVGYQFGPEQGHDIVLSYTNLKNKGSNNVPNTGTGVLVNRLSQIVQKGTVNFANDTYQGGQYMTNATASVNSYIDFQTADLITHRNFQDSFLSNVQFSRYYGIKASGLKKGFTAWYAGDISPISGSTMAPLSNQINYEAKYFGIGPRIGMGASWALTHYLSIVGDVSASALGGSYNARWQESLQTSGGNMTSALPVSDTYSYNQTTKTKLWTSLVVGSNLALATNFDLSNGSSAGIQAGINTEQYWSQVNGTIIASSTTKNILPLSQRFAVRDLFIKLNYLC